jgi:hypothetical protein
MLKGFTMYKKVLEGIREEGLQRLNRIMLPTLDKLDPEQLIDLIHETRRIRLELDIMKTMLSGAIPYSEDEDDEDDDEDNDEDEEEEITPFRAASYRRE